MEPNDALAGRYELREQIGASERAMSFHAHDRQKRQMVVIKRFEATRLPAGALTRYAAAVAALKRSSLPGVVLPLDVVTSGTTPFAVYCPLVGESVAQLLTRGGPFSWPQAADIVCRCATVLSATLTSTSQSHRALKPSNLWLAPTGEVSVLDLGIAELGVYAVPPRDGPVFVEYRAPEQIDGAAGDARSDVFVLGVLLYELATGIHPFAGSSAFHVARQLILSTSPPMSALTRGMSQSGAREAEKLLARALARAPAERFAGAQEFLQALEYARRVIGAPSRLAQAVEMPASTPVPTRPVLIVEDLTTIIQPPGLGAQRRVDPARPQPKSSATQPAVPAPPSPAPASSAMQAHLRVSAPPQPVPPVPVRPASPPVARPLQQLRELAPAVQKTEPLTSQATNRMSVLPAQPCERTEMLPSTALPPVTEHATERDLVAARPCPLRADDELRTEAFAKHVMRPTVIPA
jgi:serine/threonine protein kinase